MLPSTDKSRLINIHCLFNPSYVDKLENEFFNKINCHSTNYPMNRQGIIDLGKDDDPSLYEENAYKKGISKFNITIESCKKFLKIPKILEKIL